MEGLGSVLLGVLLQLRRSSTLTSIVHEVRVSDSSGVCWKTFTSLIDYSECFRASSLAPLLQTPLLSHYLLDNLNVVAGIVASSSLSEIARC